MLSSKFIPLPIFAQLTQWLEVIAHQLPLTVFVAIFELIAPIPSQSTLIVAGSLAAVQGKTMLFLGLLVLISAFTRTVGSWFVYFLAYKAEGIFLKKWGKSFGITERNIDRLSKKFNQGHKDIWAMMLIRAVPIVPGMPIDIAAGMIKMKRNTFLLGTFLGLIPHNILVLYLGYRGGAFLHSILNHLDSVASVVQLVIFVVVVVALGWAYWKHHQKQINS